jgi:hypothetical protein
LVVVEGRGIAREGDIQVDTFDCLEPAFRGRGFGDIQCCGRVNAVMSRQLNLTATIGNVGVAVIVSVVLKGDGDEDLRG